MRNLLFGNFLPNEDGTLRRDVVTEVQSFDTFDRIVQKMLPPEQENGSARHLQKQVLWEGGYITSLL